MKKGMIGAIILAVVIFGAILCCLLCLERVPAGYVGVVYNMNGGVDGEVLTQGWHFVAPTKKVTTYSIGIEQSYLTEASKGDSQKDESFNIPTSDGKTVKVDLEFSYKFDVERVADTFVLFKGMSGEKVKETFIKPKIVAWTQEISANYPVTDIFGDKRTKINAELDIYLRSKFEPYGIIIDTVNFTNISVDDETAAAIQKKVTAQQEMELAEIEAKTALIQAEKDKQVALMQAEKNKQVALTEAEAQKEVARIEAEKILVAAEAQAEAIRIEAEARAEANKKIAESLTPELLEKIKYEQWNGELPGIVGGDSFIVDTRSE
jgi:regulator of protease activity HflC (stomatin/prohibitin superfamily)